MTEGCTLPAPPVRIGPDGAVDDGGFETGGEVGGTKVREMALLLDEPPLAVCTGDAVLLVGVTSTVEVELEAAAGEVDVAAAALLPDDEEEATAAPAAVEEEDAVKAAEDEDETETVAADEEEETEAGVVPFGAATRYCRA